MLLKTALAIFLLAASSYPQSDSKSWHQVLEVKGSSTKQTDLFEIRGSKWRIRWQKPNADSSLYNYVYDKSGSPFDVVLAKGGADESYMHQPGTFYMKIAASDSYIITVEDWR